MGMLQGSRLVAQPRCGLFVGPRGPRAVASLPHRRLHRLPRGDTARSHLAVDLLGTASMPPRRSVTRRTRQHPASLLHASQRGPGSPRPAFRRPWLAARLRALPSSPSTHRGVRSREAALDASHRCNAPAVPFPCARGMSRRALPNPRAAASPAVTSVPCGCRRTPLQAAEAPSPRPLTGHALPRACRT